MAIFFIVSRYIILALFFLCVRSMESVEKALPFSFSLENLGEDRNFGSQVALYGDAEIRNSTVMMFGKGLMMYGRPVRFSGANPSFSTSFEFSISEGYGESLGFLMVPRNVSLISADGFLAVKFGLNLVAIDVRGKISAAAADNLSFKSGGKLHCWIDYDGVSKMIEVRVCGSKDLRPLNSMVSCPIDLSNALWREAMYVGISSSSENSTQTSSVVYSWIFEVKQGKPYLMHSEPLDPESLTLQLKSHPLIHVRKSFPWKILTALLVGAAFGAVVASLVFYLRSKVVKRHPIAPVEYPVLAVEVISCEKNVKIALDGNRVVKNAAN